MEPAQPAQSPVYCQCNHRHGRGIIGRILRCIGLIVLFAIVFAAGCAIGGTGHRFAFGPSFHDAPWGPEEGAGRMMMLKNDAGIFNVKLSGGERQFGVITAISGQTITIADNGGGTQTIQVNSDTIVMDGTKEIPVWNLRRGYSVRAHGRTMDGGIAAKFIEVIR